MRAHISIILLSIVLFGCQKIVSVNCDDVKAPTNPVSTARFRIMSDITNEDLIANNTLSFDSLIVTQPCNINDTLKKVLLSYNNGFQFYFSDIRQPVIGENTECYDMYLKWDSNITDKLRFEVSAEHTECHTLYRIDRILYNNKEVGKQDGYYLLRR